MMSTGDIRIALVHDELIRRGGAEVVFEELLRIFPQADVYSLYAGRRSMHVHGRTYPIHTSFLQNTPVWFRRHPRRILPLLPYAAEQLDFSDYDVVISSASGFIKGIVTRANVPHICYCHTPTRYLWEEPHHASGKMSAAFKLPGKLFLHYLRLVDFTAAQRVDHFLANSRYTQERIATFYRRGSTVVYPPIATAYFTPDPRQQRKNYFLVVGRLTPSKNIDHAIYACQKLRQHLVIIGRGHHERALRHLADASVTFISSVSRARLRQYYREAQALLQPGVEDFGMASAEAQACGTPVIAYGRGGVIEIVRHGETGYLYRTARVEALAEALRRFISREQYYSAEACQQQALPFSSHRFEEALRQQVHTVLATKS